MMFPACATFHILKCLNALRHVKIRSTGDSAAKIASGGPSTLLQTHTSDPVRLIITVGNT